jgi:DNA polymerase III alpha subunit (gram-positive type)
MSDIKYPLPHRFQVVFDLETTDAQLASVRGSFPSIVQVGACLVDSEFEIVDEFCIDVCPPNIDEYTEFCENLTSIQRDQLIAAKSWVQCWRKFADFTKFQAYRMISWGVAFDYGVLRGEYARAGVSFPHGFPFIDALSQAYFKAGEFGIVFSGYSLRDVCKRLDIEPEDSHQAITGARKTLEVLRALACFE